MGPSIPAKRAAREKSAGQLTATELAAGHMYWLRVVQREIFTSVLEALQKTQHCQVTPK